MRVGVFFFLAAKNIPRRSFLASILPPVARVIALYVIMRRGVYLTRSALSI